LIAETLYQSAARVSEIVGLRRDNAKVNGHVDLRLFGKGSKERKARITRELYDRIMATFPEGEYLFTTEHGHPYTRQYISCEIDRAARRLLGRSLRAHTLRHSRATDLIAATGKVKGVSRLLGHADESTTLKFYVKQSLTDEELFEAVQS
jgi:integrase/recombinase XerD